MLTQLDSIDSRSGRLRLRVAPRMRSSGERTDVYISSIVTARPLSPQEGASLTLAPIMPWYGILVECLALWGERERSRRQYSSQVSVFKSALFTEKKRRTVADSVANVGESVAYLGLNTRP